MTDNAIIEIMNRAAADTTARMVTSQSGCVDDWRATVRNLKEINDLLCAKRLELKKKIGVDSHMYQLKIRKEYHALKRAGREPPSIMAEYITLGQQIHRLNQEYARVMKENGAALSPGAKRRADKRAQVGSP